MYLGKATNRTAYIARLITSPRAHFSVTSPRGQSLFDNGLRQFLQGALTVTIWELVFSYIRYSWHQGQISENRALGLVMSCIVYLSFKFSTLIRVDSSIHFMVESNCISRLYQPTEPRSQFWDCSRWKPDYLWHFSIVDCQWTVNCLLGTSLLPLNVGICEPWSEDQVAHIMPRGSVSIWHSDISIRTLKYCILYICYQSSFKLRNYGGLI